LTDNPFLEGHFVWCAFPEHENPLTPGPRHIGYILAVAADERGVGVMVAYTTSQSWVGETPRGVRPFTREQARALGQDKSFRMDLRRIAFIPVDAVWFPDLTSPSHGIVSRAPERLRLDLEAAAKEIFGRHSDIIERLGPLF